MDRLSPEDDEERDEKHLDHDKGTFDVDPETVPDIEVPDAHVTPIVPRPEDQEESDLEDLSDQEEMRGITMALSCPTLQPFVQPAAMRLRIWDFCRLTPWALVL